MVGINIATTMPLFCGKSLSGVADNHSSLLHDATVSLLVPHANLVEMMRYPALQDLSKEFQARRIQQRAL